MLWNDAVVADALKGLIGRGVTWGDIFQEQLHLISLGLAKSHLHEAVHAVEEGGAVRTCGPDGVASASTNILSGEALEDAVRAVRLRGFGKGGHRSLQYARVDRSRLLSHELRLGFEPAAVLREIDAAARSEGREVVDVGARFSTRRQSVRVVDTAGRTADDERAQTTVVVQVIARRSDRISWDQASFGCSGPEWGIGVSPSAIGSRIARDALTKLDAVPPPTGKLSVVMGPGAGGVFLHEACGHGLEGDAMSSGTSIYSSMLGERVTDEQVTLVDDPTLPGGVASYAIDDDGTPARRTTLIDRGAIAGCLTDRVSAAKLDRDSSGHSRRPSYEYLPQPRMTNLSLERGDADPDEIVRSVRRGIYVTKLAGGQVNATTGRFVFTTLSAFQIDNGAIGPPIESVTMGGAVPDALMKVEVVGSDHAREASACMKNGQMVTVSSASPTLLLRDVLVGGA